MKNLENQSELPKVSFEDLKDKTIFVTHRRIEDGTEQFMTLRAKVQKVFPGAKKFNVIYEGNENLIYDHQAEVVSIDQVAKYDPEDLKPLIDDGNMYKQESLGKWIEHEDDGEDEEEII